MAEFIIMSSINDCILKNTSIPLFHYSEQPLKKENLVTPESWDESFIKPNGLWLSYDEDGNGWKDWCVIEKYNLKALRHKSRIVLKPETRIFHLNDIDTEDGQKRMAYLCELLKTNDNEFRFNWNRLRKSYDGIIITNYCRGMGRIDSAIWYYALDCECACIWNMDVIASVESVEE